MRPSRPQASPCLRAAARRAALSLALLGTLSIVACSRPTTASPGAPGTAPSTAMAPQAIKLGDGFNGITCDQHESVLFHIHTHLAIYANGQPVQVPHGIGIGQPHQVAQTPGGPFVTGGSCFAWLHTHTPDGILHIESPITRTFTLGDFFAVWGHPLTATQVGPIQGQVFAYVDGQKASGNPAAIPLTDHGVIQLNVGSDTPPPQPYEFPSNL